MRLHLVVVAVLCCLPSVVRCQQSVSDSLFRRAERLVRDGDGAAGRALVDSVLAAAPQGSALNGEALYWRATLAASSIDAERDLARLMVEYAAHPRAEDAILRLAQLELARGDRERALAHLQRFEREHGGSPERARASLLLARLHLDRSELARGCAALANARASVSAGDAELRNQIEYYASRCSTVQTVRADSTVAAKPPAETTRAAPSPVPSSRSSTSASGRWTVQVAAFQTRAEAEQLVRQLAGRGIDARIAGTVRPFRVRVGRHAARTAAVAALRTLRARGLEGFVTETER